MRLGKKKLILLIEEAKLPPPNPDSNAIAAKNVYGVLMSLSATPVPSAGIARSAVVTKMTFLPPPMAMRNEFGSRSVAPAKPAIAGRV